MAVALHPPISASSELNHVHQCASLITAKPRFHFSHAPDILSGSNLWLQLAINLPIFRPSLISSWSVVVWPSNFVINFIMPLQYLYRMAINSRGISLMNIINFGFLRGFNFRRTWVGLSAEERCRL